MTLPVSTNYQPMEALPASELPAGPQWSYEPKWDGFRCLAFRDGARVDLAIKIGQATDAIFSRTGRGAAGRSGQEIRPRWRNRHSRGRRPFF